MKGESMWVNHWGLRWANEQIAYPGVPMEVFEETGST